MDKRRLLRTVTGILLLILAFMPLVAFNATSTGHVLGFFSDPLTGLWGQGVAAKPLAGQLVLPGLSHQVVVVRDEEGVPHIFAETEHDLFQAFGFIQACDRLWQMDLQRRIVYGRLSELFGERALASDKWMRMLGLGDAAEKSWKLIREMAAQGDRAAEATVKAVEAFTRGVNECIDYLSSHNRLPLEYRILGAKPEPWRPEDSMAVAKLIDYVLSFNNNDLVWGLIASKTGPEPLALYVDYRAWLSSKGRVIIRDPGEIYLNESLGGFKPPQATALPGEAKILNYTVDLAAMGKLLEGYIEAKMEAEKPWQWIARGILEGFSNNWVVGGSLTASGHPLLANDPHLLLTAPPIWYEVHLYSKDTGLNVYGVAFPGVPFIVIGRNNYIAFGYTNSMVDVVDLYYYVWRNNRYYYNGSWLEPVKHVEEIRVKTPKGYRVEKLVVLETVHGRIAEFQLGNRTYRLAVRATTLMPEPIAVWAYLQDHARSVYEYLNAQRYFYSPIQNAVVADKDNILYSPSGLIPVRSNLPLIGLGDGRKIPNYGMIPYNGSRGEGEWIGFIPFNKIPRLLNPSWGYVATANNLIVYNYTVNGTPLYLQWDVLDSYRWVRIASLIEKLSSEKKLTLSDMKKIQMDTKSMAAEKMIPLLLGLVRGEKLSPLASKATEMLRKWDYEMNPEKPEPSIAYAWLYVLINTTWSKIAEKAGIPLDYHLLLHILKLEMLEYMLSTDKGRKYLEDITGFPPRQLAKTTLEKAVKYLEEYFSTGKPEKWVWGKAHRILIAHILGGILTWLNYPPRPEPGGPFTVNVAPMIGLGNPVTHGPSVRFVADLAPGRTGEIVLPGGDSGHPFSKYYENQYLDWLNGVYHKILMPSNPSSLKGETLVLKPG